jgi:hypothetical protein
MFSKKKIENSHNVKIRDREKRFMEKPEVKNLMAPFL